LPCGFILDRMNELDEVWSELLARTLENAKAAGKHDVADYLTLKAANDAIRQTGVRWLFDSMIEIAGQANRSHSGISIEREDPHSFVYQGSNMVGSLVRFRHGVRCLTLEAGWTRTPADGFMRGGSLAFSRIVHFGITKANTDLTLEKSDAMPVWKTQIEGKPGPVFRSDSLRRHFQIFTGD